MKKLDEIKEKIKDFEEKNVKKNVENSSSINIGLKLSLDLISPIIVGICIGLGMDKIFFTKPIFFLIFLLLGIFAGFFNIYKSMNKLK
tara:strand:- start:225 stop:488 length:264 start_codon:yes stop_codon:yes gene_type:complete